MSKLPALPMQTDRIAERKRRVVHAPASVGSLSAPALLSIELDDNDDVCWHTTYFVDGRRMVTGYTIVNANALT
jgi:hypothetical protein